MSLLGKFSFSRLASQLGLTLSLDRSEGLSAREELDETVGNEITMDRIKDLIIDAHAALDENKRVLLLERADELEALLVETYRAKGLKITADNICKTLEEHRRRHHSH